MTTEPIDLDAFRRHRAGRVFLVGAGPGDPELLTLKGKRCLESCDVVVFDALVDPALLEHCGPRTERIHAGKRHGAHSMPQAEINALLVRLGRAGKVVTRLKGGDPFVFGRGGEEALALADAGIPFEVVPGVSAGSAVPAYAGVPVTHRGLSQSVTFVTGHPGEGAGADWTALARVPGTIVVFMGLTSLGSIAAALVDGGKAATTPVAVIAHGTKSSQRTVVATLATIAAAAAELPSPALVVVGDVVSLRGRVAWRAEDELARVVEAVAPRCATTGGE
ncbi:MAG: uroporphyrinogen-III C-methyltransferase [Deltaproteobacteria bacterium]|nr:uroporphyrinogen-III C-methyltransferase [Deltaproteobacteria bacterium]